jgi:hypothetical protein
VAKRVLEGRSDQPFAPLLRHRLDPDADVLLEADLRVLLGEVLLEELKEFRVLLGAGLELDPRVDVLGVLPEDHHVHLLRRFHRGGHAVEVADRSQADVEIEELAEGHVEGADAAADGSGERALDADQVLAERLHRLVGEPVVHRLERLFARQHLVPGDLPLSPVGLLHRRVEHHHRGPPDVAAGPVALDEWDEGVVRDVELALREGDFLTGGGRHGMLLVSATCEASRL